MGNAFVQQFFHILHKSPELVHRFYQESSRLGRPGDKGEMSTTSSLLVTFLVFSFFLKKKCESLEFKESRCDLVVCCILFGSFQMLKEINEKILSMDYTNYRAQIKTVDAQESLNGGVLVLVTGYLFGKNNVKRDFTQTFFLATQDTGYYVLNDIFRYVEEADQIQEQQGLTNETEVPLSPEDGIA